MVETGKGAGRPVKDRLGIKDSRPLADFLPPLTIAAKNSERRVNSQEKKPAAQSGKLPEEGTDGGNDNG